MDRHSQVERQHDAAIRRHGDATQADTAADTHPLLQLQRQIGNAQIARMLAQRQTEAPAGPVQLDRLQRAEEDELEMSRLQRADEDELEMSRLQRAEEDELEMSRLQRADEDELEMSRLQRADEDELEMSRLQRADEDELEMSRLQRADEDELEMSRDFAQREPEVGLAGGPVSSGLSDRINTQRGGGAPLDGGMRDTMEGGFGADFADVRVHTGAELAALNRSIAGRAFTTGSDIFLSDSASPGDSQLMAHELTHVVQQRSSSGGGGPMTVTAAGDAHEQEAESTASAITSGAPAPAAAAAQRKHDD